LTLYISIGKDSEQVPDVVGQSSSLADITFAFARFVVKFTTEALIPCRKDRLSGPYPQRVNSFLMALRLSSYTVRTFSRTGTEYYGIKIRDGD